MAEGDKYVALQMSINFINAAIYRIISDNREIESRIFQLAKAHDVPLFEKDDIVDKNIQSLYRVRRNNST